MKPEQAKTEDTQAWLGKACDDLASAEPRAASRAGSEEPLHLKSLEL